MVTVPIFVDQDFYPFVEVRISTWPRELLTVDAFLKGGNILLWGSSEWKCKEILTLSLQRACIVDRVRINAYKRSVCIHVCSIREKIRIQRTFCLGIIRSRRIEASRTNNVSFLIIFRLVLKILVCTLIETTASLSYFEM